MKETGCGLYERGMGIYRSWKIFHQIRFDQYGTTQNVWSELLNERKQAILKRIFVVIRFDHRNARRRLATIARRDAVPYSAGSPGTQARAGPYRRELAPVQVQANTSKG
jgi:hypothetical protein